MRRLDKLVASEKAMLDEVLKITRNSANERVIKNAVGTVLGRHQEIRDRARISHLYYLLGEHAKKASEKAPEQRQLV